MAEVLTADALAYCSHTAPPQPPPPGAPPPPAGRLTVAATQPVLTVDGVPVLLVTDVTAAKIAPGCPSQPPCATVLPTPPVTGSAVLTVNGTAVATMATTAATNAGTVALVAPGQAALTAD